MIIIYGQSEGDVDDISSFEFVSTSHCNKQYAFNQMFEHFTDSKVVEKDERTELPIVLADVNGNHWNLSYTIVSNGSIFIHSPPQEL